MVHKNAKRPVKLAVLLLVASVFGLLQLMKASAVGPEQVQQARAEIVGQQVPMELRTGEDDGAMLALHFSGETHGVLEPCG